MNFQALTRKITIRLFLPPLWRRSKKRTSEAMLRFATTENDGAWQGFYAIQEVQDPVLRAKIFQHTLEEVNHGALFRQAYEKYTPCHLPIPAGERIPLYRKELGAEALTDFFSYENVGESDVAQEFATYAAASPYEDITSLFLRLEKDERGHSHYTQSTFCELEPSAWKRFKLETKVRAKRLYASWGRLGFAIGVVPSTIILSLIYFITGPFTAGKARKRFDVLLVEPKEVPA